MHMVWRCMYRHDGSTAKSSHIPLHLASAQTAQIPPTSLHPFRPVLAWHGPLLSGFYNLACLLTLPSLQTSAGLVMVSKPNHLLQTRLCSLRVLCPCPSWLALWELQTTPQTRATEEGHLLSLGSQGLIPLPTLLLSSSSCRHLKLKKQVSQSTLLGQLNLHSPDEG